MSIEIQPICFCLFLVLKGNIVPFALYSTNMLTIKSPSKIGCFGYVMVRTNEVHPAILRSNLNTLS